MSILYAVLGLVIAQRIAELAFAAVNTWRLLAEGGLEIDRAGYPWLVALHAFWLVGLALLVPATAMPSWPLLGVYAALQAGRLWVITSLGRRWTTRIIVLPGAPLVRAGPYRWLRHPNYAIVSAEIPLLPLAFGAVAVALVFSAANFALLARRIAIEDRALSLSDAPARPSRARRRPGAVHPGAPDAASAAVAADTAAQPAEAAAVAPAAARTPR
jgi:methyltransferase